MKKTIETPVPKTLTKKQKDDIFPARLPSVLQYHQLMLADGVRNKLLYQAIKAHVTEETNFLDVGAGTGVWAILAAKLGAKRVVAIEIEESLIPMIFKHAKENGVAQRIEIIHGNSDDVKIRGKFDVIVSELFGGDALGEGTVKSFVSLRNRFLAPGGILIPQKLAVLLAPVKIGKSIQDIPAELPITCSFLKSTKMNYGQTFSLADRERIKFLAEPQKVIELEFATVEKAPSFADLSASWQLENLSEANGFVMFNRSTFTDEIDMDSFGSQSWGTTVYEFQPFEAENGEMTVNLTMDGSKSLWSVSAKTGSGIKTQSFSPAMALARLRMTQQMTPHRKFRPKKAETRPLGSVSRVGA